MPRPVARDTTLRLPLLLLLVVTLAACNPFASHDTNTGPAASSFPHVTPGAAFLATTLQGELLVEPDDGNTAIVREISQARSSIDFTMYLFTEREVIDAFKQARSRGVAVRGMLEQHPYGTGPGNDALFNEFTAAGLDMRWTNPAFRLTHEKALMIDQREAFILTLNFTHSAFTRNREFGVIDRAAADVAEVEAAFSADWNRTAFAPALPHLVWSPVNARVRTIGLLESARTSIDVFAEELQDQQTEETLAAAARRGVAVRVVMPPLRDANDTNGIGVRLVRDGGVKVHTLDAPYIHAKVFLIDGTTMFLGSENISTASLESNREAGIIVNNADMIQRVQRAFDQDWATGHD